jgi:hypothetical protein
MALLYSSIPCVSLLVVLLSLFSRVQKGKREDIQYIHLLVLVPHLAG